MSEMTPEDHGQRRLNERMTSRTARFDTPDDAGPKISRDEAEKRASYILKDIKGLPPIVLESSKPSGPATTNLEHAIDVNPMLASRVLAAGGTAFFVRSGQKPSNLASLIDNVGTAAFRNITLMASFLDFYEEELPWYNYEPRGLWWHLVGTAVAAWQLGKYIGMNIVAREVLFMAGMLHDIGKPTVHGLIGGMSVIKADNIISVLEAERSRVSIDHSELVPLILDIWGVEHAIFSLAENHHNPKRARSRQKQAEILQLADLLANMAELGLAAPYRFARPSLEELCTKIDIPTDAARSIKDDLSWTVAELASEILAAH